ncbi:amino acid adenylation domain-containing protein [Actinosynnema sp. CS-041913]|uniref:acyl carrier protein n=1 Tax=Actinosynnema sp. CS-041913 TaxID=3239917 RepID=UPI003D8C22D1
MLDEAGEWGGTARVLPEVTVVGLFRRQVERTPDAVALVSGGEAISYRELHARSNRLARRLRSCGAEPGRRVAVVLPRSVDLVVALLAVQKSGAAYVPVDPGYPADRVRQVLDDVEPIHVLTGEEVRSPLVAEFPADDLPPAAGPADPVYVIYTSGSTGRPKGVVVPVRALVNFLLCMAELIGPRAGDRLLAVTTPSFDIAALELYLPLLVGGTVVVAEDTRDPAALAEMIREHRITHLQATPSLWQSLVAAEPEALRGLTMLVGGEALPTALAARMVELGASVRNLYGPTETTIWSTSAEVRAGEPPTIGVPIWNTTVHVLDARRQPVPDGEVGELHIGGLGVALGYWRRPELTAERFPDDPWGPPGARLYRTGDLGRRRADGRLEYLGRTDDQVKVRGFRVELGEVESVLGTHPAVARAAVAARDDAAGFKRLVGYLVPAGGAVELADVRAFAAGVLPAHMLPSVLVEVADFPLTPNGKLDRKALPDPDPGALSSGRKPRTERETVLCALFAELLGLPEVAVDDDFFRLGGHSLLAARLVTGIRSRLGVEAPVSAVFDAPTAEALAAHLDGVTGPPRPAVRPTGVAEPPLSAAQRGLWLLHRFEGPSAQYNLPLLLTLSGALDVSALSAALTDVVDRHDVLRTVYPEVAGEGRQVVRPLAEVRLSAVDVPPGGLDASVARENERPFDIETEAPSRFSLFRLGPDRHVLHVLVHHIACDGWSVRPLVEDLAHAYRARLAGHAVEWRPLPVRYADFTVWQHEVLAGLLDRQLEHWTRALHGLPPVLDVPALGRRPARRSLRAGVREVRLDRAVHARLAALAQRSGTTVFMVLQAGLAAVLSRFGAGDDIAIGCPVAGRADDALDGLVGYFVNTLVLRADTSGDPTFAELLRRVRAADLAAYAHQDAPFERVVEAVNPVRSAAHHPLFQVMLTLHNQQPPTVELPGLRTAVTEPRPEVSKVDLEFELRETFAADGTPDGIVGELVHALDFVAPDAAELLIGALTGLLDEVSESPDRRIGGLSVPEWRATAAAEAADAPVARRSLSDAREARLCALFAEVLGVETCGVDDDFFKLGGQSLTAVRLMSRVRTAFDVAMPMRLFFEEPTVAGVLARLDGVAAEEFG